MKRIPFLALFSVVLFFSTSGMGQPRWQPWLGLHVSGDAELYYLGPSFQAGTDFVLNDRYIVAGYIHYFGKKVDKTYENGEFEKGKYRTLTTALLLERRLGRTSDKGIYLAAGLVDRYQVCFLVISLIYTLINTNETNILPGFSGNLLRMRYRLYIAEKNF